MTRNQIEYWRLQETKRSNLANEQLKAEANRNQYNLGMANIQLGYSQLAETTRANKAREQYNLLVANRQFTLDLRAQAESERMHRANELLQSQQLAEQRRHALESERLQNLSVRNDQIRTLNEQRRQSEVERQNRVSEMYQGMNLLETQTSHRNNEAIARFNASENQRANLANERIRSISLNIQLGSLNETRRSNLAREAETNRSNRANEMLQLTNIATRTTTELIKAQRLGGAKNGKTKQQTETLTDFEKLETIFGIR